MIVSQAFEDWMSKSGNIYRIFARQMTWEVYGGSAASGLHDSAGDFANRYLTAEQTVH